MTLIDFQGHFFAFSNKMFWYIYAEIDRISTDISRRAVPLW